MPDKKTSIYYDVGERIRFYRKLKNLSLSKFGNMIGKTKSTVCRYETNDMFCTRDIS